MYLPAYCISFNTTRSNKIVISKSLAKTFSALFKFVHILYTDEILHSIHTEKLQYRYHGWYANRHTHFWGWWLGDGGWGRRVLLTFPSGFSLLCITKLKWQSSQFWVFELLIHFWRHSWWTNFKLPRHKQGSISGLDSSPSQWQMRQISPSMDFNETDDWFELPPCLVEDLPLLDLSWLDLLESMLPERASSLARFFFCDFCALGPGVRFCRWKTENQFCMMIKFSQINNEWMENEGRRPELVQPLLGKDIMIGQLTKVTSLIIKHFLNMIVN